ncbi:MAG: hypothetical protein Q4D81_02775 [Eubacteriales bacterium]|nr:hypothetical protein [Eubacteriales bacterium]
MVIYFYCSYAHSRKGFTLTRLKRRAAAGTSAIETVPGEEMPGFVNSFFSFDGFRLLYMLFQEEDPDLEMAGKSVLGVRNLRGSMRDGRNAYANILFVAETAEAEVLKNAALDIIGNWNRFREDFIRILSPVSAEGRQESLLSTSPDYSLETDSFLQWLADCPAASSLKRKCSLLSAPARILWHIQHDRPEKYAGRFLYMAVCTCAFEEAAKLLVPAGRNQKNIKSKELRKKPSVAVPDSRFIAEFAEGSPLWEAGRSINGR